MEGAGGGGFGYVNLQNNPSLYRPSPPLTAIERFFSSKNNHFSHKQTQNNVHNQGLLVPASVYGGFSSSGGAIGSYSSDFLGPSFPEKSFMDRLFHDSETLKWTYEIDPNMGLSEDDKSTERNCKGVAKRAKGGSSTTTLIKGQWTDEEDSIAYTKSTYVYSLHESAVDIEDFYDFVFVNETAQFSDAAWSEKMGSDSIEYGWQGWKTMPGAVTQSFAP
ncbi:hypothetical protein ACSBR2_002274 [Camellia fascicularis]